MLHWLGSIFRRFGTTFLQPNLITVCARNSSCRCEHMKTNGCWVSNCDWYQIVWGMITMRHLQTSKSQTWWRHQMETFSALLAIGAGNSPVPGKFPAKRPAARSFDVFFDFRLNKRLKKQSWGWWFQNYRAQYGVIVMLSIHCLSLMIFFHRWTETKHTAAWITR